MKRLITKVNYTYLLTTILLYLEFRKYESVPYSILIKDIFNNVYMDENHLNVVQLIFLVTIYTLIMWEFILSFSKNLREYKRIICWHSSTILEYYGRIVIYFSKKLLSSMILYTVIFSCIYMIVFGNINIKDMLFRNFELIKVYILFFYILIISIILKFDKIKIMSICYVGIIVYVLVLNRWQYSYYVISGLLLLILLVLFLYRESKKDI